jgi:sugar phosphate isomerase/epimerase
MGSTLTASTASQEAHAMHLPAVARRTFLAAGAAVVGSAIARRSPAAHAADRPNLGIQLYSLRGYTVDEALQHARDLGLRFVEFYPGMFPMTDDAAAIAAMKKKVADLGLTTSAYGVVGFTKDADANRRMFTFAKAAGIGTLGADPDPESFASLDELVKEFDIRIAIHNHGPTHRYNKAIDVLQAIEKHDPRIGACADLGHYLRSGQKPTEVIRLLAGRLYGIHLKDFADMQDQTRGVILGRGHIDVPAVFAALEQAKFPADGALSIEYEEHPENPLEDLRECVRVAREALAAT